MRLHSLQLQHFRNYQNLDISFDPEQNLFALIGQNAQGKTNFVEAISMLALTKSFRVPDLKDITNFEETHFRIAANYNNGQGETGELEMISQDSPRRQRKFKVNGVELPASQFIGHLAVTLFNADDIHMLFSAPAERRRYFDMVISQLDHSYILDVVNYQKTIKQRNKLLKLIHEGRSKEEELMFWDEQCLDLGLKISAKREELIAYYNKYIEQYYSLVSGEQKYSIQIQYQGKLMNMTLDEATIEMRSRYPRDIALQSTSLGPHRDDWCFEVNEMPFVRFGSRGELRSMILALKLVEREYINEKKGTYPILILDDVFSELDDNRKQLLIDIIQKHQTFITTTDDSCLKDLGNEVKVWEVANGEVQSLKLKIQS